MNTGGTFCTPQLIATLRKMLFHGAFAVAEGGHLMRLDAETLLSANAASSL